MRDYGNTNAAWVGLTAPTAAPENGQLWWRSDDGNLYVSYNDGTSTQWVPAVPVPKKLAPSVAFDTKYSPGPFPVSFTLNVPFKADVFSILSCSAFAATSTQHGVIAALDGVDMARWAEMYWNVVSSHTFVTAHNVNRAVAAGNRTVSLRVSDANLTSDNNDRIYMTFQMIEVP